ncbi:MAG: SCO family protein, partial [Sphingomonas bacterium]|nr:SCO family protein [Sphingomonas bacterium]
MLGRVRLMLWVAVGLAALALLWFTVRPPSPPRDIVAAETPLTAIGGAFMLVGADGQPFASTRLTGKPFAIFFG